MNLKGIEKNPVFHNRRFAHLFLKHIRDTEDQYATLMTALKNNSLELFKYRQELAGLNESIDSQSETVKAYERELLEVEGSDDLNTLPEVQSKLETEKKALEDLFNRKKSLLDKGDELLSSRLDLEEELNTLEESYQNLEKVSDSDAYKLNKVNSTHFQLMKDGVPTYDLMKKQSNWTCTCTGFKYRGKCKHLEMLSSELPKRHPREELDAILPDIKELFKGFDKWEIVGSYRRGVKDFKDIDILVECSQVDFLSIEEKLMVDPNYVNTVSGPFILRGRYMGYDFDINRVIPGEWGSQLLYRTGSKDHNIKLRGLAKSKGWSLNEHGLFDENKQLIENKSEEDIYKALGLEYVEPKDRN